MIYEKEYTNQISFPLGGIGTGSVGLSGTGRLIDWEIFGRPNKQSYNGYSHFAIKVEKDGKVMDTRILNADLAPHYMGGVKTENIHSGFGFGPDQITMAGFPHFKEIRFEGEFPVACLSYRDEHFPSEVKLTAFNPMIPSDAWNSSIPAAFFEFEMTKETNFLILSSESKSEIEISKPFKSSSPIRVLMYLFCCPIFLLIILMSSCFFANSFCKSSKLFFFAITS